MYAALGVTGIDLFISSRKLLWAGHVMRMSMTRLPRMFMTSWIAAPRRNGRPQISYGHDLTRELNAIGFNLDREAVDKGVSTCWGVAAQDKETWRKLTRLTDVNPSSNKPGRHRLCGARSTQRHYRRVVLILTDRAPLRQ
jgi:hypothetical protein